MSDNAKVGGVLSIVSGGLGIIGAFSMVLALFAIYYSDRIYYSYDYYYYYDGGGFFSFFAAIYITVGIIGLLLGALALVGGIQALRRKRWGLAIAGAIASCLTFLPCGVVAVVFVAMGKPEFAANQPSAPPL